MSHLKVDVGSAFNVVTRDGDVHEIVTLAHPSGSKATVSSHGAHIISWMDSAGRERLYLSRRARFGPGDAIRGGIPVVFPQFASGPLPKHGLVRTRRWSVVTHHASTATFHITDDEETRALWPYRFLAELRVDLSEMLTVRLNITNTGDSAFSFTAALHNYFKVTTIETASVRGLAGLVYLDKTADNARCVEERREVRIRSEMDRIYIAGPRQVTIPHAIGSSATVTGADGFGDWVVWNPWRELTASLPDMEPHDYLHMLCVEAARVADPVVLEPERTWAGIEVMGAA